MVAVVTLSGPVGLALSQPLDNATARDIPGPPPRGTCTCHGIYYRIPRRKATKRRCRDIPVLPANGDAFATESKWASDMRYTHGLLKKREVGCDCSPGRTSCPCCNGRFENRDASSHLLGKAQGGFMAFFQLWA